MFRCIMAVLLIISILSCHSTRKIKSAISSMDTVKTAVTDTLKADTAAINEAIYKGVQSKRINFSTFSAKMKVEYVNKDGKGPDLTVIARIKKDSAIWLSINATVFSYEAFRVLVTPD